MRANSATTARSMDEQVAMTKNYTEELAAWIEERSRKGRGKKLAVFFGVADDVRAALDAGYSAKTIWSNLQETGRIDFRYETFMRYVNRLIKKGPEAKPGTQSGQNLVAAGAAPAAHEMPPPPASTPRSSSAGPALRAGMPTFKCNPLPHREDTK
jgi:hypothetical protein